MSTTDEFGEALAALEQQRSVAEPPDRATQPTHNSTTAEQFADWFEGREHLRTEQITNEILNESETK